MAQIVDVNGNPLKRDVLTEPQTASLGWITRDFAQHPTRGLTPKRLHEIMQQAEYGDLMAQSDLFVDMEEKDAHLFAEMSKRKRALLTLDWRIVEPKNASAEEKNWTAQLLEWFTDLPDFDDVLLDCMDAVGHGFSAQEIEWQQLGKVWLPKTLTHRPQRWFRTPFYDGNDLRLRDESPDGAPLWSFGWLVHKHRAKSGYLTRAGLHRTLAWPYLFKNYATADFAEFLEIYGLPLRVGKYPSGATKEEKATLLRAVAQLGHNAAGIIPQEMMIEFQKAADGTEVPFDSMIDRMEKCESKAILGGTLTSQADGKTSTNALGNTHNEVRRDLLTSDARQVQKTLTGLCYMLCALNLGAIDPRRVPRFEFDTRETEDLALYADAIPKLVGAGMKIGRAWAQEKLMIPEPQQGEDVLTIPKPQMALPPEERPDDPPTNDAPRSAALRYRAVLTNQRGEIVYPDQHALDETIDGLSSDPLIAALDAALRPVVVALSRGSSADEAYGLLLEAYPQMDDTALVEQLQRCIFVADVWGRLNAG